jgi:hypothetical protein
MARMMLNDHRTPRRFWADAISTSCYISNRIFWRSILHLTPFELHFGRKPFVSHFSPFGCKCFVLKRENLDKFESRSFDGILVEYTPHGISYRVYNFETNTIVESWIFCLVLILMFHLAFTLVPLLALYHVLCLTLLLVLRLSSLMDPSIAHMVLVHERTTLSLDALVTAHVLIVVIISCIGLVFPLEGPFPTLSRDTWMVHDFPVMVHIPLNHVVRCKGLWKLLLVAWLSAGFLRFISLTLALNHRPFLVLCR